MKDVQSTHHAHYFIQGQYKVIGFLSKGTAGAVYLVEDARTPEKQFALKEVIRAEDAKHGSLPFDIAALKRLNHPALPRIYRVFKSDTPGRFCILMDYFEGSNLEVMRQLMPGKRFSLHTAMTLMSPIMDAASYLHHQHPPLVHADIKPSNIIAPVVGTSVSSKLVDFGGVINMGKDDSAQPGALNFRAPEQFHGRTSRRSDIYALGAVFYTLLTGIVPASALDRLTRIEAGEPDPLMPMNRFVPSAQAVADALHHAMSLNKHDRYTSVEHFREALWQVIHEEHVGIGISELKFMPPVPQKEQPNDESVGAPTPAMAADAAGQEEVTSEELPSLYTTAEEEESPLGKPALESVPVLRRKKRRHSANHRKITPARGTVIRKRRRRKPKAFLPAMLALLLVCVSGLGVALSVYQTYNTRYQNDLNLAQEGVGNLKTGLSLLQSWQKNPLDASPIPHARLEFVSAAADFTRLNTELQALPGAAKLFLGYSGRLSAALHLMPVAIEVASAGISGCDALQLIIDRFHEPFGVGLGLTLGDLQAIDSDIRQIETDINLPTRQINSLQPADLQIDPRISREVAAFHRFLPTIEGLLHKVDQLLPVLPALLGVSPPAYYLVEILDTTNLRPGGGVIKDYGFATIIRGRLNAAHVNDVNLLDRQSTASGLTLPLPAAYRWFDLASNGWNLRDSNLDADFPTAARYAEQNFNSEGARVPLQGVLAITPALMERALALSGPITVPELHITVTAQNLTSLIHFYELGPGSHGGKLLLSPDGPTGASRYFTELLAQDFLEGIHQYRSTILPKLLQMFSTALLTKDFQVYFNASPAESLLQFSHMDAAIPAASGDTFFVVDANLANDNANQFITSDLNDRITIDGSGNVTHLTTMRYTWSKSGEVFGSPLYRDYVRLYVPTGSTLRQQQGWRPSGTSTAFDREVWASSFTLVSGQTRTITLTWTEKNMAKKDATGWHYRYLIERQAGVLWTLNAQIRLPACAAKIQTSGGHLVRNGQTMMLAQTIVEDTNLDIGYSC